MATASSKTNGRLASSTLFGWRASIMSIKGSPVHLSVSMRIQGCHLTEGKRRGQRGEAWWCDPAAADGPPWQGRGARGARSAPRPARCSRGRAASLFQVCPVVLLLPPPQASSKSQSSSPPATKHGWQYVCSLADHVPLCRLSCHPLLSPLLLRCSENSSGSRPRPRPRLNLDSAFAFPSFHPPTFFLSPDLHSLSRWDPLVSTVRLTRPPCHCDA